MFRSVVIVVSLLLVFSAPVAQAVDEQKSPSPTLKLLFLGDKGHHQPARRFQELAPVLEKRGMELKYTDNVADLNSATLGQFAGLVVYANIDEIKPEQAKALLDYVASGRGFIPLHCASFCFRNNAEIVALIGAQFQRHGTGTFRVSPTEDGAKHPLLAGYGGFESWDETYVHTKHNETNRTVLEFRTEGESREPWTWVRTHGQGRVFYTAWGHDARTFTNPGFHNLVERGIRWACGQDPGTVPAFTDAAATALRDGPKIKPKRTDVKPFEYEDGIIPFYPPGERWGTVAEPVKKLQKPLSPEESLKHFVTPEGFDVELFAAEPQIGKPLAMNWDERGRLWLCETVDYPNELQEVDKGRDRIRICEDTDGDNRADKFTVFAEGLSIPTAIEFYRGGAIVQDGVQTIYLRDNDGDNQADLKKVLITGWALGDTHGGVSNFHYGFDGWYYAMQGYNNSSPVLTDGTKVTPFRQGFFRFKVEEAKSSSPQPPIPDPSVAQLEFLRSTNNNTWGLGFSEEGLIFGSTANGNPSEYMPIPNRYYERVKGWSPSVLNGIAGADKLHPISDKVRQVDHHGGFTAAAGHALYTARAWPKEYWNRTAFVCEPTAKLIATFVITPDGAGFKSKNMWNIVASDDEWSAPIMAEVGPDSQLWFIDWYNLIVQHNPTPAGYKTGKGNAYEIPVRDKTHGRIYRVVWKGDEAKKSARINLAGASPEKLAQTLGNDNLFWRLTSKRLLLEPSKSGATNSVVNSATSKRAPADSLQADNAQTRLAAFLALSDSASASAEEAQSLVAASADPRNANDRWILDAATSAAAVHAQSFLLATFDLKDAKLAPPSSLVAIVSEHYARTAPADNVGMLLEKLPTADPTVVDIVLAGFAKGWPKDQPAKLTEAEDGSLVAAMKSLSPASRANLVTLASRWGSKKLESHVAEIAAGLLASVQDANADDNARSAAAKQLVGFKRNDVTVAQDLLGLITPRTSPQLGQGFLEAIGQSEANEVGAALAERLPALTPSLRTTGLRILLGRAEWTAALLDAVAAGKLQFSDLSLDQKQALAAHPNRQLARRARSLLEKGGGLPNADRQKVVDELMPLTKRTADAVAGQEVFKKQCTKCHTHSGEGTKIGPDLTGMAVHPKHELLIHMIDPSRSVEGNFRLYTVALEDGRVLTGLLSSESKTAIEVIDSEAKRHSIQRDEIEELVSSPKSLMPDGFEKQVSPDDIANLLEFLTKRGKFLPLPLDKVATIVTTKGMFFNDDGDFERLIFQDWSPKSFEGVPFVLVDPQGTKSPNAVMLNGPHGNKAPRMPRTVSLTCNSPAKTIHLLSGISGWGFPAEPAGGVSLIVRLLYADGTREDHPLINGEHFADYIRRVDVPKSKFAFALRGQQLRYLTVTPTKPTPIAQIELVKGSDNTAPVVMAVTIESAN